MTRQICAWVLLMGLLLSAGCARPGPSAGQVPQSDRPVDGGTLHLSLSATPKGVFNPILYEDQLDGTVLELLFDGLLRLNGRLEFVCQLCRSMEIAPDNRQVTFRLKPGIRWHDGAPFTAEDVAFTVRTMLHPDYPGVRTGDFAALLGVERLLDQRDVLAEQVRERRITAAEAAARRLAGWEAWLREDGAQAIQVIDSLTVAFTLSQPYAPFLQSLALRPIPAHLFRAVPVSQLSGHPANRRPVGTGPYRLVEYRPDQYIKLERFTDYHGGAPHIPTVVYRIVNQEIAVGQLLAGEIDAAGLRPGDLDLIRGHPDIRVHSLPGYGYQYLGLNHDHPVLGQKAVRQALAYGIDREGIVRQLLKGHGRVVNSHLSPAAWAYDLTQLHPYPYSPERAQALLAEAGWRERNQEGILTRDGRPLSFTLKYPAGNRTREATAQLIQANLKALGIQVELQVMEFATLARQVFDERNVDAWLMGWSLGLDPDPGAIFLPESKWGRVTGWRSRRSEELIRQGVRVLHPNERRPIYTEWARLVNEELPYVFLFSENGLEAVRTDRVQGLRPDARGALWNIPDLWIPLDKQ